MGIVKEWVCKAHGEFESDVPVCPKGCKSSVRQEFRTAPMINHRSTRNQDELQKTIAHQLGATNLSNKNGSVGNSMSLFKKTPEQEKASRELAAYEQSHVASKGGDGVLRDKTGKPIPTKPYNYAVPTAGRDEKDKPKINLAALPAHGNHMSELSQPRARLVNKKGDEMGMAS